MSDIVIDKAQLPFVLGGATQLAVRIGSLDPLEPLPDAADTVFDVSANGGGQAPLEIGGLGRCTVSLKAGANAAMHAIRPGSRQADEFGLTGFFARHPDRVALLLDVGTTAGGTFDAHAGYSGLTAATTLQAGSQGRFAYVRAY